MSQDSAILTPLEARILGVLVEKQHTTPDVYPLSLNALVTGCNQKTSRDPVMNVGEPEALRALEALRERGLVSDSFGASGRVMRYSQHFGRVLELPAPSVALLAVLMLRGPQTPGELRGNCERLHRFADTSTVEAFLEELAARRAGPLVARLPRQAGSREHRWAHLLCGAPEASALADAVEPCGDLAGLRQEVAELREEVAALRALVEALRAG